MSDHEGSSFPRYHVASGLIWREGKLLIATRPPGTHLEGLWEFPGGKQEEGEGLEECLEREIQEELGIRVRVDEPFLTVGHSYPEKRIWLHVFNCTYLTGEPEPVESQEIRWVSLNQLSALSFPPPDILIIEKLTSSQKVKLSRKAAELAKLTG